MSKTTYEIHFWGISLFHRKGSDWVVYMPFEETDPDKCHDVRFHSEMKNGIGVGRGKKLAKKGRIVEIKPKNSSRASRSRRDRKIWYFLNLNHSDVHGRKSRRRNNRGLTKKTGGDEYVEITLKNAKFEYAERTKLTYGIFERSGNFYRLKYKKRRIGQTVKAVITATSDLLIKISGENKAREIGKKSGKIKQILFDNDCYKNKSNDFQMLYNIVTPIDGKKLYLEWLPDHRVTNKLKEDQKIGIGRLHRIQKDERRKLAAHSRPPLVRSDPTWPCFSFEAKEIN